MQAAPASHPAYAKCLPRKVFPLNSRFQDKDNTPQARSVIRIWTTTLDVGPMQWEERLHTLPKAVWNQFSGHAQKLGIRPAPG